MARWVAFLRAINVGGHTVTMERLRREFTALGCTDVATFIASGNVIFTHRARSGDPLGHRIEEHLAKALGFEVATFLRSESDVAAIASYRPFDEAVMRQATALNVGFLYQPLPPAARKTLMGYRSADDDFQVHGREVYWACRTRQSESGFFKVNFERAMGARVTFRSLRTVVRLAARHQLAAVTG